MSSKKNRKRDSSSSEESESSPSPDTRKINLKHSHESDDNSSKRRDKYKGRARSSSHERGSSKYRRSRSRSNDWKTSKSDGSHSRDSGRQADRESGSSRIAGGDERRDFKDRGYDSRNNRDDRRKKDFRRNDNANRRKRSRSRSFDHANAQWGTNNDPKESKKDMENKAKPNFGLSGKLTEETNTFKGVVIKYSEPPEARKPRRRWRLYPFKGDKALQTLYIHRESGYLIGRDRKVVDLAVDHPSCSKQHAALQYRLVPFTRDNGSTGKRVRPYLIDLESANGTFINNKKIEPKKYVELLERDVLKFGFSSREYVLLHENSKDEALDDDVKLEDELKEELDIKEELDVKEEQD